MFTLEQIIKMEQSISKRKLPVDIEKMMEKRRYSATEGAWVRVGDLPLHRILRAWAKEVNLEDNLDPQALQTIMEPSQ